MFSTRLKRVGLAGLVGAIAALLILYLSGAFGLLFDDRQEAVNLVTTATEESAQDPQTKPTEESVTIQSTEAPTEEPTKEPTQAPTVAPTVEPTEAPTEEPTVEPTPQPAVQSTWRVVEGDTDKPLNQVLVKIAYNQSDPVQEYWTNENGEVTIEMDQAPSFGSDNLGLATFWAHGTSLELSAMGFRLDADNRSFVLVNPALQDISGPVRLYAPDQVVQPEEWEDGQVWPCSDLECATQIAATSPYFGAGEVITCQETIIDSNGDGTWQWYRAANGWSIVAPTSTQPNFVGPDWPNEGEARGWMCGNGDKEILVASGCGNIAIDKP